MSKKIDVVVNMEGLKELRKSPEVVDELQRLADGIVAKCPNGKYETSQWIGPNRANVSIATYDTKTYFRNLHNNELLKALK